MGASGQRPRVSTVGNDAEATRSDDGAIGFSGRLRNFPLFDIIQMACVARRDGKLRIRRDRCAGEVVIRNGRIIHAATKLKSGEAALLEMLCWTRGNFEFVPAAPGQELSTTIIGGWEKVLMDAVRRRDEMEHSENENERAGVASAPSQATAAELMQRIAKESQRQQRRRDVKRGMSLALISALAGGTLCLMLDKPLSSTAWELLIGLRTWPALAFKTEWHKSTPTDILIPGGSFLFQDNQRVEVAGFCIDSNEVTVWQYQEFLRAVGADTKYDHPNQRPGKGHSNPSWEAYAKAAFARSEFNGVQINPNFPAVYIDWFDAYAFANWEHRRLPSEVEWEKAGRGTDGRRYPWGDESKPGAANLYGGAQKPASWSEVNRYPDDRSSYGVHDLAGNVSEWTASDDSRGSPVVRGGNFMTEDGQLTRRVVGISPYTIDARIGFRTAVDAPSR